MAKIYYDKDANLNLLKRKTIGIVGFGSQGHAHAQNLRDGGCQVVVAELAGTQAWKAAKKAGFEVAAAADVAKKANIVVMLAPDTVQPRIYRESIEREMTRGKTLMFAHGFSIHFSQIVPPSGALVAVHQDASGKAKETALAYAKGIGCARAGVLETTFAEETETDLFGEQTVLCGGVSSLIKAGFETLIEAGYQPEIAYFEVCHELKLIVDLIYQGGLGYMRYSVSDTAEYGDYTRGPRVIDDLVKEEMQQILAEIQDGSFATEWVLENQAGRPSFNAMKRIEAEHPIEVVGKKLRSMMPWLKG